MKHIWQTMVLVAWLSVLQCEGFWGRSKHAPSTVAPESTALNREGMQQNLVVNVHFNPLQMKTSSGLTDLVHQPIRAWGTHVTNFIINKKYSILAALVAGGYLYWCYRISQYQQFLERPESWSYWRHEESLDQFIAIPLATLEKDLILEVQRRYSNPQNPTDFITPLIRFARSIDEELLTITQCSSILETLTKLHIIALFPLHESYTQESLQERHKRLTYIKNIFLSWAADYNVTHNRSKSLCVP